MPKTAAERATYKRNWAERNQERLTKRRHDYYWKNPVGAKAAAKAYHHSKRPHVSDAELERLRVPENRSEVLAYGPDKKLVCLGCGGLFDRNLSRHPNTCPGDPRSSASYKEKWGYAKSNPLASADWRDRKSKTLKASPRFQAALKVNKGKGPAAFAERRAKVTAAKVAGTPLRHGPLRDEVRARRRGRRLPARPGRQKVPGAMILEILALDLPVAEAAKRARFKRADGTTAHLSQTAFYRRAQSLGWTARDSQARRSVANRYMFGLRRWLWTLSRLPSVSEILEHHAEEVLKGTALHREFGPLLQHFRIKLESHPEWIEKLADRKTNGRGLIPGSAPIVLASKIFKLSRLRSELAIKRDRGRPTTKRTLFVEAKKMHDAGNSWTKVAKKLVPAEFSTDAHSAAHRLRIGVQDLDKRKP